MIALILILLLLAINLFLHTLAIKFGAKWAQVPGVTVRRAVVAALVLGLASLVLSAVVGVALARVELPLLGAIVVPLAVTAVAECLLMGLLLRTSVWRAALAWLPRLGVVVVTLSLSLFLIKPFVLEAFIQTSHSMAPTLFGPHIDGLCPHCGGPSTISVDPQLPPRESISHLGMCSVCQQAGDAQVKPHAPAIAADRFVVCKLLPPDRWDLVAVSTPVEPSILVVERVVGLPGEQVVIRDGSVWINGEKQNAPAAITKLKFTTAPENTSDGFGSPAWPTQLGQDEYFVIGDFSLHSADSRTWGPVKLKDISGVVSLVYFPFDRVRLLK